DGEPPSIKGLHLVRDGNMGVQIRIPSTGVAGRERRGHQTRAIDRPERVSSLPGEQRVPFDEAQRVSYRSLMREFDLTCELRVGDRPQRRHRLDRGEGQVIAGYRLGAGRRPLGGRSGDLAGVDRVAAMLVSEELPRDLGAHLSLNYRGD